MGRGVPKDRVRASLWAGFARTAGLKDEKLDAEIGTLSQEELEEVNRLSRREAKF